MHISLFLKWQQYVNKKMASSLCIDVLLTDSDCVKLKAISELRCIKHYVLVT